MDWQDNFQEHIQLLQQAREADLTNPFVCHGIVHIFQEAFDLGLMAFREALKRDGQGMAAMGSAKELIAAAYEPSTKTYGWPCSATATAATTP